MRQIKWIMMALLMCCLCSVSVFGQSDVKVNVNGSNLVMDEPPVIVNGRTLVPLRAIFEALGVAPVWNGDTMTVTAQTETVSMSLTIGNDISTVNSNAIQLEAPATLVNGRTMVPARFIAETFESTVNWDAATSTVLIVTKNQTIQPIIKKTIMVGVSLPTMKDERWVQDKEAMETWAKAYGVELILDVGDNHVEQAQQVDLMLAKGIKVLILAAQDSYAAATIVDKANSVGVPVIAYDRMVRNTSQLNYYFSFNNEEVGQLQGRYFVEHVPKGNIILVAGTETDNNAMLFYNGAMSVIQPKIEDGTYTVLGGADFKQASTHYWIPANAKSRVQALLHSNAGKDINGVLSPNDGIAGAIIEAFKEAAVKLPVITGQDTELEAIRRIKNGEQSMSVFKDTRKLAKEAIIFAAKLARGEAVSTNGSVENGTTNVPAVLLDAEIITIHNYQEVLIDSGYIQASKLE